MAHNTRQTDFTIRTGRDFFTANILRSDLTEHFYRRRCIGTMRFDEQSTANADMAPFRFFSCKNGSVSVSSLVGSFICAQW